MTSFLSFSAISPHPPASCGASFRPRSFSPRLFKSCVKCTYAEAGLSSDSWSAPIDVMADVKSERVKRHFLLLNVVVLGGNGFVGSAMCKAALSNGIEVVSVSRSGRPNFQDSWLDQVTWVTGDVFYLNWDEVLLGATAIVSTIGGFGNEEQMKRINGEANVTAVNAAKDFGVPKFVLITVHDYNLPPFILSNGYFTGKRNAEAELLSKYPTSGVVLRPGFIYGKRKVNGIEVPLDLVGKQLDKIYDAAERFIRPLRSLPASDLVLAPPVNVDDLALAVINAVKDDDFFGIFTIEQIKEAAAKMSVKKEYLDTNGVVIGLYGVIMIKINIALPLSKL